MGQCVTVNVGNSGAVTPSATEAPSNGGGTNVSIGNSKEDGGEDEEEEEDEGICSCIESGNCLPWV